MATSIQNEDDKKLYTLISEPKINAMTQTTSALQIVAKKPINAGITILSELNFIRKEPVKKPRTVRNKEFNPKGAADKKSKSKPEKKPDNSPKTNPLLKDVNNSIISNKSGITGRNVILVKMAVSITINEKANPKFQKKHFNISQLQEYNLFNHHLNDFEFLSQ